jgi:hypothetical protein
VGDKSKAPAKAEKGSRRRRAGVLALIILGALCIFISTLGIWIRDVALDEDEWANTSAQLLQSEDVRNVLSVYIVDQSYAASDAEARLEAALPEQLKPLAGPISAQLRGVAYEAVARALERPRVQELWRSANRAVNAQLVDVLEGNTERLQATNGAVVLNLDQIVTDVTGSIGAGEGAAGALEGRIEPITILESDQLSSAQKAVKLLKALSFWPFILGVALWAGAVYLAAGRRRPTIRSIAWSLVIIGLLILAIRRVVGNAVIDNLVEAESVRAAASDVWTVLTSLLAQSAVAGIFVGLVTVIAMWFAGPGARATAGRRWLAPAFRDHPLMVHATLAVVLLLFLGRDTTPLPGGRDPRHFRLCGARDPAEADGQGLPERGRRLRLPLATPRSRRGSGRRESREPGAPRSPPRERRADGRRIRSREGPARHLSRRARSLADL